MYKEFVLVFLGRAITRKLDTCATYAVACQEVANVNKVGFVNLYEAMLMQKVSSFSNKFDNFEGWKHKSLRTKFIRNFRK